MLLGHLIQSSWHYTTLVLVLFPFSRRWNWDIEGMTDLQMQQETDWLGSLGGLVEFQLQSPCYPTSSSSVVTSVIPQLLFWVPLKEPSLSAEWIVVPILIIKVFEDTELELAFGPISSQLLVFFPSSANSIRTYCLGYLRLQRLNSKHSPLSPILVAPPHPAV